MVSQSMTTTRKTWIRASARDEVEKVPFLELRVVEFHMYFS